MSGPCGYKFKKMVSVKKKLLKTVLSVIFLFGFGSFLLYGLYFIVIHFDFLNNKDTQEETATGAVDTTKTNFDLPERLVIPAIDVNVPIEHVGLTSQGEAGVPKGPNNVAWFELGPRPGEKGSAVISGHYGWKDGIPAVFDNLYKLQVGDRIYVENGKGLVTIFVVRESRRYGEKEDASDVFGPNGERISLNLVTCEGVWNKTQQSYSKRLVVFADKE